MILLEPKRGGICGIMGDRYINNANANTNANANVNANAIADSKSRSIWYMDANNLYVYAMKQKLPYKDFN